MSDEKANSKEDEYEEIKSRRKVLGKMLITGGVVAGASFLPNKWTKPIVDFIQVPAHAQTSTFAPTVMPTISPTLPN